MAILCFSILYEPNLNSTQEIRLKFSFYDVFKLNITNLVYKLKIIWFCVYSSAYCLVCLALLCNFAQQKLMCNGLNGDFKIPCKAPLYYY